MERPNVEYLSPKEDYENTGMGQHHFDLVLEGKKVGGAEINYFSKPLPLYQLTDLYIDNEFKGKGYASKLLEQFEAWLKSKKKPGVLVEAILDERYQGMYAKRGWIEVPNSGGLHVFNWPTDVDLGVLKGYSSRYSDSLEQESYS